MKRRLLVIVLAAIVFTHGVLLGRYFLVQHERERALVVSAQRARNTAEAYLDVLTILEDLHTDSVRRGNDAADFCSMELARYYKWYRDSDDTCAPGQRYLLNHIRERSEEWPELKQQFEKWVPPDTSQPHAK